MGHRLYIAGLYPNQYIWCEACNSYTGTRAQKLLRTCTRIRHPSRAINRLRSGNHPDDGKLLTTLPRRVTRRDVGTEVWISTNGQVPIPNGIPDAEVANAGTSMQAGLDHDSRTCLDIGTHPSSFHSSVGRYFRGGRPAGPWFPPRLGGSLPNTH